MLLYIRRYGQRAAVQLINKDEDNNEDKGKDKGEDEALEVEFAAIKAILNQGNDTDNGNENKEVNEDNE